MAKLRDLITEREFGEPLPTFKDVMEKHQVNKLKEDWWDDMSPEDQASYIKKHPGSKQAQSAKDDAQQKGMDKASDLAKKGLTKGPGGYGDRGNVRGGDQRNFGEPDDEEYFKSMMGPDTKTDIFGNVPEDPDVDPYGDDDDDWETHGVGPSFWDSPTPGNEPDDDAQQKGMDKASDLAKKGMEKGEPANLQKIDRDIDALKGAIKHTADRGDWAANKDWKEKLAKLEKEKEDLSNRMADDEADDMKWDDAQDSRDAEDDEKQKSAARTGTELNQETLTINGKQFRRISESVEKEEKPKYEFSEFYQRFKR